LDLRGLALFSRVEEKLTEFAKEKSLPTVLVAQAMENAYATYLKFGETIEIGTQMGFAIMALSDNDNHDARLWDVIKKKFELKTLEDGRMFEICKHCIVC